MDRDYSHNSLQESNPSTALLMGNRVAQADILGQSYEYLIKKFADATNKKAGEFYTPRAVVRLMVNIPRYVEPHVEQDVLTVEEAMQRLQASAVAAFAAEDTLIVLLKREGLLQ